MRRRLSLLVLCTFANTLLAQHITHHFHDVSMTEALQYIQSQTKRYDINFIANELEDFRVTTDVKNKSVTDAILQVAGLYPIRVVRNDERKIYVECTHKTNRHLRGRLVDESNNPVAFANIALLSPADSTLLGGGVSNENGDFVIPYERPTVLARISFVGYKTIYRMCSSEHIGTIRMQTEAYTIKGVVVKGDIPQYQMTTGGMTVHIQGTLLSQMGTATDVLSQLPRVTANPDGDISVYGKGTPIIYINNRQVKDKSELTQLKSEEIKNIEIISAPGAQYDGTVEAVIRIRTIHRRDEGFSLRTSSQLYYRGDFGGYEDLSMRYRTGRLEVFFNSMYNNMWKKEDGQINEHLYALKQPVYIEQSAKTTMRFADLSGKLGVNYDINDSNSVGMAYQIEGSVKGHASAKLHQDLFFPMYGNMRQASVAQTMDIDNHDGPDHDLNVYYIGKLGKLDIDFNGTAFWKRFRRFDESLEYSQELEDRNVHINSGQRNSMLAAKLVLGYPLWKGQLNIGSETTHTKTNGYNKNDDGYVSSSETDIRENNTAVFGEYSLRLGNITTRIGLRYEHVNSSYFLYNELQPDLSRTYDEFFPNLSIGWSKGKWSLQLNYSKRTQRPGYWQLRNSVQYDNRYSYEGGNPELRPSIRHGIQFDAQYSWLSIQAYYNYTKDVISWVPTLYDNQPIAILTNRNFNHRQNIYVSLTASPKFVWYQPTWEVNCAQLFFDAAKYGSELTEHKPEWEISLKNHFVLSESCFVVLGILYYSPWYNSFQKNKESLNVGGNITKSFFNKALTIRLSFNDIFNSRKERWTNYGLGVNMHKDCNNFTRNIALTITYNLNPSRSKYKGTGAGNEEKSRL